MARPRRTDAGGGLFRTIERTGLRKGTTQGSKAWFYVGSGLWTLRTIRRMAERKEEILVSEQLRPGERIVISNGLVTREGEVATEAGAARRGRKARKAQKQARAEAIAAKRAAELAAKAERKARRRRKRRT